MSEHHPDPNPVRPSAAEGDPDETLDEPVTGSAGQSPDPRSNRPSQAEGESDD